ncbi:MAG TPA: hypothetical protein VGH76_01775, partial [Actinomycetospora sp.]
MTGVSPRAFARLGSGVARPGRSALEVVAADVRGDLAYLLAIERTTASVGGSEPTPYQLRSTTIFRRED